MVSHVFRFLPVT